MDGYELIDEGLLNPHDRRQTCPRCGDVARLISRQVFDGGTVNLACADGHRWAILFLDLPTMVMAQRVTSR